MVRNIYVGDAYSRKVVTPLITTDCNSYKIIWDSKCTNGNFKITAIKADGASSFDFGTLSENGLAEYIISNNMYNTAGPLKLFLAIVENESITTCREINFTVKQGADETTVAENNINHISSLVIQMAGNKAVTDEKMANLQYYGMSNVYILKEGEDILITDGIVTELLKNDYSDYEAIAFPEGITEIRLPEGNLGGGTPFVANKVIMPDSLRTIGPYSFSNYIEFDEQDNVIEDTVIVKVQEYVLNEGIEKLENYAFSGNVMLEKINIPSTLTMIDLGVFQYCDNLKKVIIPSTVTDIGDGNFTATSYKKENSSVIYGFAGSEAERYAKNANWLKNYENEFVNIGSDYSNQIGDMETALNSIIEIQNRLIGGENE